MPKIYSGVPAQPTTGREQAGHVKEQFTAQQSAALEGIRDYSSCNNAQKNDIIQLTRALFSAAREFFFEDRNDLALRNDARKALLAVQEAIGQSSASSLQYLMPRLKKDIFIAEKMILMQIETTHRTGGIPPEEGEPARGYIEEIINSTQNGDLRALGRKVLGELRKKPAQPRPSPDLKLTDRQPPPEMLPQQAGQDAHLRGLKLPATPPTDDAPAPPSPIATEETGQDAHLKELKLPATPPTDDAPAPPSPIAAEEGDGDPVVPPPHFAHQVNEDAYLLHHHYALLKPDEQHALFCNITKTIAAFTANLNVQDTPEEADAMAIELRQLSRSTVGFLRRLDKTSRESVKQSLHILNQWRHAALAGASNEALAQMTPNYVITDMPQAKLERNLDNARVGSFAVTTRPFPDEEFLIHLKTAAGISVFPVKESSAPNGAILYTFDGAHFYSNLATLVKQEFQIRRQFTLLRDRPTALLAPADQVVHIKSGEKSGKKEVGNLKISHLRSEEGREYIISSTLKTGAFGKLRYALDQKGGRWAVKEFRSEFARHKRKPKTHVTNLEEIKAEIETMQNVDARCKVIDAINIEGKVYAVMPMMAGELGDVLHKLSPPDRKPVGRSILRQVASDLSACHKKRYVHKDVKPPNILWNSNGEVAITDFGLTVPSAEKTDTLHGISGTPAYMAPELFSPAGYNESVDVWSLALSIADVHVNWWESPFRPPQNSDIQAWSPANFKQFQAWRATLFENNELNTQLVGTRSTPFDTYFGSLNRSDPDLCRFILTRMLVVEPENRISIERILFFMNRLQPPTSTEEEQVQRAFATLAGEDPEKETVFTLLEQERRGHP